MPSLKLTVVFIITCSIIYPLVIAGVAKFSPGAGRGETIAVNGKVIGYANIGQNFTDDKYFWGRPSAVNYNAAGSGGSNKAASNPDYQKAVQARIDRFLLHNPGVRKIDIPSEMVTASGSGLDPDISPASAYLQAKRVAKARGLQENEIKALIDEQIEKGWFGPAKVNVLKLNSRLK